MITLTEADITINGQHLTDAESMTLRVALQNFLMELDENGLGEDQIGKALKSGYVNAGRSINEKLRATVA